MTAPTGRPYESCPVTAVYRSGSRRWTYWCEKPAGHKRAHSCNGTTWTQPNQDVGLSARDRLAARRG